MNIVAHRIVTALLATIILVACNTESGDTSKSKNVTPSTVEPVEIIDLGTTIASASSMNDSALLTYVNRYRQLLTALLKLNGVADSATTDAMKRYASLRSIEMFQPEVSKAFPTPDSLTMTLTNLSGRMATLFEGFRFPTVYTVVIPFNQSIIIQGDTAIFLGLNHYLGAGHPAYNGFAGYIRSLKSPDRLSPDIAEALIALSHPFQGKTVLSRLLYEGALIEAIMQSSAIDEQTALGYSDAQYSWAQSNEKDAWNALLNKRMLFSTDKSLATRLIAPAPSTSVLNVESPGRLGRFIGHRIVASYIRSHPEAKLPFLLSASFYDSNETLGDAHYND